MKLAGDEMQAFAEALLSAFPSYNAMERMLRFKLGPRLANIAARELDMKTVAFRVVDWAETEGKLEELLSGARAENSGNPDLKAFTWRAALMASESPSGALAQNLLKDVKGLQARVSQDAGQQTVQYQDFAGLIRWMLRAAHCTCRVEIPSGTWIGTGFLVAPDLILTNWHVAEFVQAGNIPPEQSAAHFDYMGADEGKVIPFAAHWHVADSPVEKLDYALIRLSAAVSQDDLGGEARGCMALKPAPEGWLAPSNREPQKEDPVLIFQHPDGQKLQLAAGIVTDVNDLFHRIAYTADTIPGSSGSPCLAIDGRLIALHHHGQNQGNHGISLWAIVEDLEANGITVSGC